MKNINEQPSLAVATTQPQAVAVAPMQGISIEAAFNAAASKALDKDSLAVMQQLLAMDGERKFNTAFVALMSAIPPIVGYRAIPDRAGNTKFEYANFEDIDTIVRPICQRHGFCYSFKETGYESGRVTTTMMLTHAGGHTREIPCTVRIGQGPPGTSEAQNDLGAHTFGKRGAIEMGLSLHIISARDDAKMIGNVAEKLSPVQSDEIEQRIALMNFTPSQVASFLKWAGGDSCKKYSDIPAAKYEAADNWLRTKEQAGK